MGGEWFREFDKHFRLKADSSGSDEAAFIIKALHLVAGSTALDAPCGAGRIAIHCARAGIAVTGIDLMESYIVRAKAAFRKAGLAGSFYGLDMRQISFDSQFDGVYNWQGSFGFFSDQENADVVRRFARALRPGGKLLIDQPNREYILRHFKAKGQQGNVRTAATWNRHQQRAQTRYEDQTSGESWNMTIRLYTAAQFRRLVERAGLVVEAMYGSIKGERYVRGSRRIIVVAQKPLQSTVGRKRGHSTFCS
jgi:SAM-dependent methyltransferase